MQTLKSFTHPLAHTDKITCITAVDKHQVLFCGKCSLLGCRAVGPGGRAVGRAVVLCWAGGR